MSLCWNDLGTIWYRRLMRSSTFRDMKTAPLDGTTVEVRHGPDQEVVRAHWSGQGQAWTRADDPLRRALHRVTGWRPVKA